MRAVVRLLVLAVTLVGVAFAARRVQYPGTTVTVASGNSYDVSEFDRQCRSGVCVLLVHFYTPTVDREELRGEAEEVALWAREEAVRQGLSGVLVGGVNPGALRVLPPRGGRGYGWVWRTPGEWSYVGEQEFDGSLDATNG